MAVRIATIESDVPLGALAGRLRTAGWAVAEQEVTPRYTLIVERSGDTGLHTLLESVAEFLCSEWPHLYMETRLRAMYPLLSPEERQYLALLAAHVIRRAHRDAAWHPAPWRAELMRAVQDTLSRYGRVHLDGVVRFRARPWLKALQDVASGVVKQFFADREYETFVAMLRHILDAQPPGADVLHVYCSEACVWVTDAHGQVVTDRRVLDVIAEQEQEEEDIDVEDVAMSLLITRAPRYVVVHDVTKAAPWPSFAETVERVFLERTRRCPGCDVCERLRNASEQNPPQVNIVFPFPRG
ncbi:sporulation protein YtxC [Alicyclobacillus cellulosilyticus]|uniref:sporulation protein YtxC n=1 Tax=Alicyclobacillus cellulosilyticus TaxID=1003997 RepID=UPI0016629847|nr:sporulation protein YtxC [Alicyclobacillus cellulosilyticus]